MRPGSWSQLNPGTSCPDWVLLSPTRPQVRVSPLGGGIGLQGRDLGRGLMLEQTFIAIVSLMLLLGKPPQLYHLVFLVSIWSPEAPADLLPDSQSPARVRGY